MIEPKFIVNFLSNLKKMGNMIYLLPKEESVINLSESCVTRLTTDPCTEEQPTVHSPMVVAEDRWMQILMKLDEFHSIRHNLTIKDIDELFYKIDKQIGDIGKQFCSFQDVLQCLKKNENSLIKCQSILDEFIDCVDTVRIERIKKHLNDD